jgi:hypothetical protein
MHRFVPGDLALLRELDHMDAWQTARPGMTGISARPRWKWAVMIIALEINRLE